MSTLPLFEPEPLPLAVKLREKLGALAKTGIYMGASSWKYEGWLGQIYTEERYVVRGKLSSKKFHEECISEYATVFPIVCGDFAFYQFPSHAFWQKLFGKAPGLQFALKVPEEITARSFPRHERYGARAGLINGAFLNAGLFKASFTDALEPYRAQVPLLIFEFSPMRAKEGFLESLNRFLGEAPRMCRYAVEVRNEDLLTLDYFALLRKHEVAHVFNAWTRMPELASQIALPDAFTSNFTVVRALLRQGRPYELAVEQLAPYTAIQDPNPAARSAIVDIIKRAKRQGNAAYVFINNRFEGNAPQTMAELANAMRSD